MTPEPAATFPPGLALTPPCCVPSPGPPREGRPVPADRRAARDAVGRGARHGQEGGADPQRARRPHGQAGAEREQGRTDGRTDGREMIPDDT